MKAYCVNLDRRPDRLAHMTAEFTRAGIAFERVAAVDGQAPQVAAAAAAAPPSRLNGLRISAAAYACLQSHRLAWSRIAAGGDSHGLVCEDDIELAPGAALSVAAAGLPADADVVKLETFRVRVHVDRRTLPVPGGRHLARLRSTHIGGAAYILRREAAARLRRDTEGCGDAVDEALFNARLPLFATLVIYQMLPAPVRQAKRGGGMQAAWTEASITERFMAGQGEVAGAAERLPVRLWRRLTEEVRAAAGGTRYVVVPYG
jgi:glycosyl transferase family 25